MNKKKPQKKTVAAPKPASAPRRKYLPAVLITLLVVAGAGYFFWAKPNAKKGPTLDADSGEEPTLTAKNPRLKLLSSDETGIDFENKIIEDEQHNIILNLNQYNGGGVAVADVNNDQLPDLYFVCSNGKNALYINQGNFKFKNITDVAGVGSEDGFETAVTAVDINADGWLDLFVCRAGLDDAGRATKLFVNNGLSAKHGDGTVTFTERAQEYGLADKAPNSGANFFDYDNDGDLDCYLINHPKEQGHANRIQLKYGPDGKTTVPDLDPKQEFDSDNLYRNDGLVNGTLHFTNVSKQAGIQNFGFGLSVSASDLNGDGWLDLYVGNDFVQPDNLFINNQKGGFSDQIRSHFRHTSMSTMGTDLTDFDNDGQVDLMSVDMFPATNYRQKLLRNTNSLSRYLSMVQNGFMPPVARNVLQRNNGNGTFSDVACMAGVFKTDWSWSCLLADLDNDGLKDLHIANGYRREVTNRDYMDFFLPQASAAIKSKSKDILKFNNMLAQYKVRNFVFQNKGDWQFEDKGGDWMTMPGSWSSGGVWADLDADGDLDLVINNLEDPAFIYKNLTREQGNGNYLQAKLQGSPANPFAVGASLLIEYQGGLRQYQELNPNHGFFSSVEHLAHFGLGQATEVDKLTVRWPDGKFQVLTNVPANQRLQLKWTDASGYVAHLTPPAPSAPTLFSEKNAAAKGLAFEHHENAFNDFEIWVLNPWTTTDLGPLVAQADVNGDGLEDVFIGNGPGFAAGVYLQNANGGFKASSAVVFEKDKQQENHSGLFFDADGDKDPDLLVLNGGAEAASGALWQALLYLNDGKGNFSKSGTSLPNLDDIGLRAAAHDYDGDGDLDIFIGGRLTPKKWPLTPRSSVWRNDGSGGKVIFTDVSAEVAGDFERCGMVTDLAWADLDGDGQQELLAVGEWMPIFVFKIVGGKLKDATASFGLSNSNGLYTRLALADLDKDGDLDVVTGNFGLNTRFTASQQMPFRCYAKDFDGNGSLDPVVTMSEAGKTYPLMQKEVLVKQMPSLKKRYLYSKDYAKATMAEIWPQKDLDAALNLVCYDLETCWWENQQGKMVRHTLPHQAQSSVVQGIVCGDFNGDGNPDLLLAGNKYGFEVETNACDAGNGVLLLGDGAGNFRWVDNRSSGFWAMREARDLAMLRAAGGKHIFIVANNNSGIQIFQ